MTDTYLSKPKRRWHQLRLRTLVVTVLLGSSGCGPSKEEQAVDAFDRGFENSVEGKRDQAIAEFSAPPLAPYG